jgi:multidrug efflux pump subunit AcrB
VTRAEFDTAESVFKNAEGAVGVAQSQLDVEVRDQYVDMAPIWSDLRNKMADIQPTLPTGTSGPQVFDDQGNVEMATIAITAEGFENYEMREAAKELRRIIYSSVPSVRKVDLFRVEEQRLYVEFDNIRISQLAVCRTWPSFYGSGNFVARGIGRMTAL